MVGSCPSQGRIDSCHSHCQVVRTIHELLDPVPVCVWGGLCERPSMPSRVIAVVCMGPGCRARLNGKLYKQQAAPSLVYSHRATKVSKRQEDGRQRVSDARGTILRF